MKREELTLAARNPYALAEIVLGHPIDWTNVDDRPALLEKILHTPYEQLFDPKYDSPVYLGFEWDSNRRIRCNAKMLQEGRKSDFSTTNQQASILVST